ncbi:MFS transporter [Phaeacidiphilus oryzae]|uniref:MFS transporter n=1 Tax=Phaeacidiphilus oryzae TaxID=348818 RepID=UPI000A05FDE5|nr:MFS transporter [Phaeacidiphilus oryzae]
MGGPAAWTAWGIGVAVYVLAVVHRTSLGVAGLDAAVRFHIGASQLSTFSLLQVLVYAAMQIPAGLLVDRIGPRRVLSLGLVLLTAGQLGFAFSSGFAPALISRAVLGCGDAMTFVSVLRLGALWFPPRRNPLMAQLTALVGMGGNLVSTAVLSRVLHSAGWTATFGVTGVIGVGLLAVVLLFLRDSPDHHGFRRGRGRGRDRAAAQAVTEPRPPVLPLIRAAWAEPGTRIGLWTHFTSQFPAMTFLLLWGEPFLEDGQGLPAGTAGTLLSLVVVSNMACGLLFGQLLSRRHSLRLPLVLTVVSVTGVLWAVVLTWPGPHAPVWLLTVLCAWMGSNGSASIVGLDFARPVNPPERIGTASGIVNMGGFIATMFCLLTIGVLLDASGGGGGHYPAHAFHLAFWVLYLPMALGLSQILRLRRRAAAREAEFRVGHAVAVSIPRQREGLADA